MTAIYMTVTSKDTEATVAEVFVPGADYTITDCDSNVDGSQVVRAEWDGEYVRAVEFRAGSHPQVAGYQIV